MIKNTVTEDPESLRDEADELEEAAERAQTRADSLEEAAELTKEARGKLKALEQHEEVDEKLAHQFDLLRHMVGLIEHNQQWGYAASYMRSDARRKESDAGILRHRADDIEANEQ